MRYTVTPAAEPRYSAERSCLERMTAAIFQTAGGGLRQSLRQIPMHLRRCSREPNLGEAVAITRGRHHFSELRSVGAAVADSAQPSSVL